MHQYQGITPEDDRVIGGGKYNRDNTGGEAFNFLPSGGKLFGFVLRNAAFGRPKGAGRERMFNTEAPRDLAVLLLNDHRMHEIPWVTRL